jgi:hypothetical protein
MQRSAQNHRSAIVPTAVDSFTCASHLPMGPSFTAASITNDVEERGFHSEEDLDVGNTERCPKTRKALRNSKKSTQSLSQLMRLAVEERERCRPHAAPPQQN